VYCSSYLYDRSHILHHARSAPYDRVRVRNPYSPQSNSLFVEQASCTVCGTGILHCLWNRHLALFVEQASCLFLRIVQELRSIASRLPIFWHSKLILRQIAIWDGSIESSFRQKAESICAKFYPSGQI
jgi:hypothetical protein